MGQPLILPGVFLPWFPPLSDIRTHAALGLAAVPVGSVDPTQGAVALALQADQRVHYLIPVGMRP
jgi:hypothetical protein